MKNTSSATRARHASGNLFERPIAPSGNRVMSPRMSTGASSVTVDKSVARISLALKPYAFFPSGRAEDFWTFPATRPPAGWINKVTLLQDFLGRSDRADRTPGDGLMTLGIGF
ncbi:transcription factor iiia [Anopheles sinensis]|uniref:Transcription factor iiia n=1 Tax=Anopheles sinensis TaxID=74873 RepID=A0A084VQ30_ANOSI|nr:transcription factor iiia [Anopheles sinensis]